MNLSQTDFLLGEPRRHLIMLIFASDNNAMSSVSCINDLGVFIDCDLVNCVKLWRILDNKENKILGGTVPTANQSIKLIYMAP